MKRIICWFLTHDWFDLTKHTEEYGARFFQECLRCEQIRIKRNANNTKR